MVGRVDKTTSSLMSGTQQRDVAGAMAAMWSAPNWVKPTLASLGGGRAPSNPMEMWLSLFPTAPMFGVRWAFYDVFSSGMAAAPALAEITGAKKSRAEIEARRRREAETLAGGPRSAVKALSSSANLVDGDGAARHLRLVKGGAPTPAAAAPAPAAAGTPKLVMKTRPAQPDNLKQIKGVGPKVEAMLNDLGIYTYAQIAAFDDAVFAWLDPQLGTFAGRGKRDDWVGQAKALVKKRAKG